ncbi:FAD binding domain-containing protein [Haloarchaeobius sp. HRN-SO-5]|uniref:FAD binding domain-containing protein n=1 Tax=Haloarchaeobius sp. HRN-SO-5 TaxID=3446118 RepID=UPI003EC11E36
MFPSQFEYHRADSVEEAIELKAENPETEILAGGHSLLPTMKSGLANPGGLVDIGDIESLKGIDRRDGETELGALTTYATIAQNEQLWADVTVLAEGAHEVGDIQVRNRGTIGGNIAHSDPASDLPGAVLAADATIHAQGPDGERDIAADDFFQGMYATDLAEDELLTGVRIPHQDEDTGSAYVKKPSPSSGYALVGVAAVLETDGDEVTSARLAANGVMDHAVRLEPTEDALVGVSLDDEDGIEDAAQVAADDLDEFMMMDDIQASAEFRTQLLHVFTRRAIEAAADRVGTTPEPEVV